METKITKDANLVSLPSKKEDRTCRPDKGEEQSCGCESKAFCSPCIFIWGAFFLYIIISYLVR